MGGGRGLLEPGLGGGAGTLGAVSSCIWTGRPSLSFLREPVGACAVFMLENGLNLLFTGVLFCFCVRVEAVAFRVFGAGWNDSSSVFTKLLGNRPMARGSLRSRPIHHEPSPALRASIKSPSMKPRSFFVSPPHEYVARHQQGNLGGSSWPPILSYVRTSICQYQANPFMARGIFSRSSLAALIPLLWSGFAFLLVNEWIRSATLPSTGVKPP